MRLLVHRPAKYAASQWGRYTSAPDALKTAHFNETFMDFHTLATGYATEKCIDACAKARHVGILVVVLGVAMGASLE